MLTLLGWELVYYIEVMFPDSFNGLQANIIKNLDAWKKWAGVPDPHLEPLPLDWEEKLTRFEKLIMVKVWRPEKLLFAFTEYVRVEVGPFFIESPPPTMEMVYADTDTKTPLIFVLSQGADPTTFIQKFAREKKFFEKLFVISLG